MPDHIVHVWTNIVKFLGLFMPKLTKSAVKGLRKQLIWGFYMLKENLVIRIKIHEIQNK